MISATFTGDDIARIGYRLDFSGGLKDGVFYLRNCGFFKGDVPLDRRFSRAPSDEQPQLEQEQLQYYN